MAFQKFNEQSRGDFPPREMIQGSWNCGDCGKEITELPFKPDPDRKVYCRDCWAKQKAQRFER